MSISFRALSLLAIAVGLLRCSSSEHGPGNTTGTTVASNETTIAPAVQTGLDRLIAENFATLKGKNVGFITNQTSRTSGGEFGPHMFANQHEFSLVALYGPEHGIRGERQAGVTSDTLERFEGVPVYSLYGSTRKPTKQMLHGVDALVFDIQDVGVRPYTYLSTMILGMEAAAENGIAFYVLDRPNPLSGDRVEGNVLDPTLKSFVGQVPVPYLHGMTLGEVAQMAKDKGWFNASSALDLHVVKMTGWKRSMYWPDTRLTWIAPSPNVPHFENALGLAMLGATGELGVLSVGVGTDAPFLRLGSTILPSGMLARLAQSTFPIQPVAETYTATTSAGTKVYQGVHFVLPSSDSLGNLLRGLSSLYLPQYLLLDSLAQNPTFNGALKRLPQSTLTMYAKVTGRNGTLQDILQHTIQSQLANWQTEAAQFKSERKPYLLY